MNADKQCEGTGQRALEEVILDTIPFVDPRGTCPVCRRSYPLDWYRLRPHPAAAGSRCNG
jgi:hypothetical protein